MLDKKGEKNEGQVVGLEREAGNRPARSSALKRKPERSDISPWPAGNGWLGIMVIRLAPIHDSCEFLIQHQLSALISMIAILHTLC